MKAQELSQKYATAVFSQALESWFAALKSVQDKLAGDPALLDTLQDSDRLFADRQQALAKILPADSDQHVLNFLYALLKEGDIGLLGDIIGDLERMVRGGPQVEIARVTTPLPLSDSDKERLRQKLQSRYGTDLEFVFGIDSTLIGGVVVQIGDKIIDGSVSTRLESISNLLGVQSG